MDATISCRVVCVKGFAVRSGNTNLGGMYSPIPNQASLRQGGLAWACVSLGSIWGLCGSYLGNNEKIGNYYVGFRV